jgi:hypothetical protein
MGGSINSTRGSHNPTLASQPSDSLNADSEVDLHLPGPSAAGRAGAGPNAHSFRATSGPVMRVRRGKVPTRMARAATIPAVVSA